MINESTRILSKRSNAFTACIMYFQNKPLRLDTFSVSVSLTYQSCTLLYDIRRLCMSMINLSLMINLFSMVKHQQFLSAEVCFWWINNRLLASTVRLTQLFCHDDLQHKHLQVVWLKSQQTDFTQFYEWS